MGEREGGKEKCPPHSTLKRVKVFLILKRDQKGKKDKNQKIIFL
jgi:hypothetical protein